MNKKGIVVTHLSFKKYLIFIGVIIGLWFLYYFFILHSAGLISIKTTCPENIIPDRIILDGVEDGHPSCHKRINEYGLKRECMNTWADGRYINILSCHQGYKEGENINYIYCDKVQYSNTPIDSEGNVGETIYLKINLVIDPIDKTDEGYKILSHTCKN